MASITVTTANICGNPLRPKAKVAKRMTRALGIPGATFGQEVAGYNKWRQGNYSQLWHELAAKAGKLTFGGGREVPISIPKEWPVYGAEVIKVHEGLKNISPERFIVVVCVQVGGRKVALVNCHPVSKPRRGVPAAQWRINMWGLYHLTLAKKVDELHAQGFTVIFGGDMNRNTVPVVHNAQRTLVESGLDHLWVLPAQGIALSRVSNSRIGRTLLMDHPILTAGLDF